MVVIVVQAMLWRCRLCRGLGGQWVEAVEKFPKNTRRGIVLVRTMQ